MWVKSRQIKEKEGQRRFTEDNNDPDLSRKVYGRGRCYKVGEGSEGLERAGSMRYAVCGMRFAVTRSFPTPPPSFTPPIVPSLVTVSHFPF